MLISCIFLVVSQRKATQFSENWIRLPLTLAQRLKFHVSAVNSPGKWINLCLGWDESERSGEYLRRWYPLVLMWERRGIEVAIHSYLCEREEAQRLLSTRIYVREKRHKGCYLRANRSFDNSLKRSCFPHLVRHSWS